MTATTETAAALSGIAAELRARLDRLTPEQRAWATLWRDERPWPWSDAAEDGFADAEDARAGAGAHHLAVLHHARAWDAEESGAFDRAVPDWDAALGWWASVHRRDEFWQGLSDELRIALGERVAADDAVAAARAALPSRLLAVHVDLALRHGEAGRVTVGRAHARMVAGSGFPDADVAGARRRLAGGMSDQVHDATERLRFRSVFDRIAGRLALDPDNPWLLEMYLDVANRWMDHLNTQKGRWAREVVALLDEVGPRVEPHPMPEEPFRLQAERARLESWQAFARLALLSELDEVPVLALGRHEADVERVVGHARVALRYEPTLVADPFFRVGTDLATALVELAAVRRRRGAAEADVEALLAEAADLDPDVEGVTPDVERVDPDIEGLARVVDGSDSTIDPAPEQVRGTGTGTDTGTGPDHPAVAQDGPDAGAGTPPHVPSPSVETLLARARTHVLDGDGPGAVRALEDAWWASSEPGRLPRIRATMTPAWPLVRGRRPWDARLADLAARLDDRGGS